ncbi:MAG: 50S ribosomal protein L3 [Planctomycetota bacterium]|jgi:large subunit ribosomal protein L3
MLTALLGKKIGMTQILDDNGRMVPVTAIQVGPCSVVQIKTEESDGYRALQIGFDERKPASTSKPLQGVFSKAGVSPKKLVREVPADEDEHQPGETITCDIFAEVHFVDVVGTSKGKGFAGVMKRWNFKGQPRTHGAMGNRVGGSIGASAYPSRVHKGKKMPGRMGGRRVMVKHLEVVKVDPEKNLLLVKGPVPGANGGYVMVRKSAEYKAARKTKRH